MVKEFRQFILRGNVLDLAIAVIIGVAFGAIVKSMVDDIIMPPVGFLLGHVDFTDSFVVLKDGTPPGPYASLVAAKEAAAVTWRYGVFINAVINFLIIALAMFLIIKLATRTHGYKVINQYLKWTILVNRGRKYAHILPIHVGREANGPQGERDDDSSISHDYY